MIRNSDLQETLIAMADEDQRVLKELSDAGELPSDAYHPVMRSVHEWNAAKLKSIIEEHGWPDRSIAGEKGAEAAWLIAQHSVSDIEFMQKCVVLIERSLRDGNVDGWQLAFLRDRVCTLTGQKQLYGTQFDVDEGGWPIPFPIDEPDEVDQRRFSVGLNSLQERISEMHERERARRRSAQASA